MGRHADRRAQDRPARVLAAILRPTLVLRPFDTLVVKEISEWAQQEYVRLEGEVRFPGDYPIARGETLRSDQPGRGLTQLAFPQGSVFTREMLKERERQQIKTLADRMRQDLSSLALQSAQAGGRAGCAGQRDAFGRPIVAERTCRRPSPWAGWSSTWIACWRPRPVRRTT
jgi:polysaccharide biosynthesis/export protein